MKKLTNKSSLLIVSEGMTLLAYEVQINIVSRGWFLHIVLVTKVDVYKVIFQKLLKIIHVDTPEAIYQPKVVMSTTYYFLVHPLLLWAAQ